MPEKRSPQSLHERLATSMKRRRTALGISQERLAERSGLHRTYIAAIERGRRNPTLATLEAIAEGLGCDPSDLIMPIC